MLVFFLVILAAIYVVWFTDWFKAPKVHVFHTFRQIHFRRHTVAENPDVTFGVEPQVRLTELKVVPLLAYEKDHNVTPVWHLVSDSNSVPLKFFYYGERIRGMRPAVPGMHAGDLETNVAYRILVTAEVNARKVKAKGQHDFELGGTVAETNAP